MPDLTLAAHRRYMLNQQRILHDTNLSPELKIVALILRRCVDLSEPFPKPAHIATLLYPDRAVGSAYRLYQQLMIKDIRRYDPYVPGFRHACQEMLPKAKRPCGRSVSGLTAYVTDVETGERHFMGWCTKHAGIGAVVVAQNRADMLDRIIPRPCANTGGALRVHLPELDWNEYWHRIDPNWEPFPERDAPAEVTAPTLRLVHEEAPAATTAARASHPARGRRLHVVRGADDD